MNVNTVGKKPKPKNPKPKKSNTPKTPRHPKDRWVSFRLTSDDRARLGRLAPHYGDMSKAFRSLLVEAEQRLTVSTLAHD